MWNETPEQARHIVAEALRSGKYTQGTYFLCKDGKHCCLGVACEEFAARYPNELKKVEARYDDSEKGFIDCKGFTEDPDGDIAHTRQLPPTVQIWLGLYNGIGYMKDRAPLTTLNDGGTPFAEIAELLEQPKEGLLA